MGGVHGQQARQQVSVRCHLSQMVLYLCLGGRGGKWHLPASQFLDKFPNMLQNLYKKISFLFVPGIVQTVTSMVPLCKLLSLSVGTHLSLAFPGPVLSQLIFKAPGLVGYAKSWNLAPLVFKASHYGDSSSSCGLPLPCRQLLISISAFLISQMWLLYIQLWNLFCQSFDCCSLFTQMCYLVVNVGEGEPRVLLLCHLYSVIRSLLMQPFLFPISP